MDHTQLECLQRCEQETVYRHVRHLTSAEESIAAFFGRVVHEGVRCFYEAEKEGSGVGRLGAAQATVRGQIIFNAPNLGVDPSDVAAAACHTYWQRELAAGLRLPEPGSKPEFRTPALAAAIVQMYATMYPPASRGYSVVLNERYLEAASARQEGQGMMAHEDKGSSLLTKLPQGLPGAASECGIVDRVVRRDADGLLYVLDLKTSSWAPNKGYWRQWYNSQQAAIYLDLAEAALGERIEGFQCDHIYVSNRKAGPEPGDFTQPPPFSYSEAKRQELREQRGLWRNRKGWRARFEDLVSHPQNALQETRSCFRMNSACPFLDYCVADPSDREDMVQRDLALGRLVVKPWDPKGRDE